MSLNRRLAPAFAATLALIAGACASFPEEPQGKLADSAPTQLDQYKVKVEPTPEQLALVPHASGLSSAQSAALGQFATIWRESGQGQVSVRAPASGDPTAVSRASAATQAALESLGVPRRSIQIVGYDAGADPQPPLLVSFDRYVARGPDCREGWDNLTSTGENRASTHFGCAVTANLAAQIANPRDILQPAASEPSDSSRRTTVLGAYRKGEVTSAKQDEQANGAVSRAVR